MTARKTDYGKGTCPECGREGISLTANGRLRSHITGPGEPNCGGGSGPTAESLRPSEADLAAAERVIGSDAPGDVESAAHNVIERAVRYGTVSGPETETKESGSWTPSAAQETASPAPSSVPDTTVSARSAASASSRATTSGPTETESTRMPTASVEPPKDAFASASGTKNVNQDFDSYGRYKLPDPAKANKKITGFTRSTTFSSSIADTYALSMWSQRMTVKGMSIRPDLVARASTLHVTGDRAKDDKNDLDSVVEQAKDAAGSKVSANLGTAVHSMTEAVDRGEEPTIPAVYASDVAAYRAVLDEYFEVVPYMIERKTLTTTFGIAGKFDRAYRVRKDLVVDLGNGPVMLFAGDYVIGDVKTGRDLKYAWNEIAIQLAVYAHGVNESGVFNEITREWDEPHDMADVNRRLVVREDVAIVVHLPVQKEPGQAPCVLYPIDIGTGWEAAALCARVRAWRSTRVVKVSMRAAVPDDYPGGPAARGATFDQVKDYPAVKDPAPAAPLAPRTQRVLDAARAVNGKDAATVVLPEGARAVPPEVRTATWEERFASVSSRGEASRLYQAAKLDVTTDRLKKLVKLASGQLAVLEEKAG